MFGPDSRRRKMVQRDLQGRGITDPRVLAAMGTVPREAFVPSRCESVAYRDRALPISGGQTISQPYMVAAMTEALDLGPEDRILEIGTGSGYQTAILAELAGGVYTVERIQSLSAAARRILEDLGYDNVHFRVGDGTLGWPEEAPYDAVLVTAAAPDVPDSLMEQLDESGGRIVIPVGSRGLQRLQRITRRGEELETDEFMSCRFVPLLGEEGWSD
ncbi:MAG: protein-L-isoaspartate(D-aspartate) O-methyltransferase [Longimicrobiales bacterium]